MGLDARDAAPEDWLAFARAWRAAQVAEIGGQLRRVIGAHGLPPTSLFVGAGCGAFLLPALLQAAGVPADAPRFDYGSAVAPFAAGADAERARWAGVCAPSVAVAVLFAATLGEPA